MGNTLHLGHQVLKATGAKMRKYQIQNFGYLYHLRFYVAFDSFVAIFEFFFPKTTLRY